MNNLQIFPANVSDVVPLTKEELFNVLPVFPITKKERRLLERMKEYFSEEFYQLPRSMTEVASKLDSKWFWRRAAPSLTLKIYWATNGRTLYEYFNNASILFGVDNNWAVNRVWVCKLLGEPYSEELFGPHWSNEW